MGIIAASKPKMNHLRALNMLGAGGLGTHKAALLAVRGEFPGDFGGKDTNDRRVYDDLLVFVTGEIYKPVNANTDPNGLKPGYGTDDSTKGILTIKPGIIYHAPGLHRGRPAFRQSRPFAVYRDADIHKVPENKRFQIDGVWVYEDFGNFAANIHDSPETSTSSLGCITVPKPQFGPWRDMIYASLKGYGLSEIATLLVRSEDVS